jgi:hypothetical protein
MTWQPIESAPRDGTRILTVRSGSYVSIMRSDYHGRYWITERDDPPSSGSQPTHWMPLPEAPGRPQ